MRTAQPRPSTTGISRIVCLGLTTGLTLPARAFPEVAYNIKHVTDLRGNRR